MQIRHVPFDAIDLTDTAYTLTPRPAATPAPHLRRSVRRVGILHPPLLRERGDSTHRVVAGRQRLLLAMEISATPGPAACPCLVLDAGMSEERVFEFLLEETLAVRPLTVVEQALFLQKTVALLGREQTAQRFLPLLGHSPSPLQIDRLLELLPLEEPLLASLHQGDLEEAAARVLVALPAADRLLLHGIITTLKLGTGKQRKLVIACRELAARHDRTVAELFAKGEARDILDHPDANPPQQAARIMAWLSRMLQPGLFAAEQSFRRLVDTLRLPATVSLGHAPAFEKDSLALTVTLRDEKELRAAWDALRPLLPAGR